MNRPEFELAAENWYQRTHKLREVWQNESFDELKRLKALFLWKIMLNRVQACAAQMIQHPIPKNLKPAGISHELHLDS